MALNMHSAIFELRTTGTVVHFVRNRTPQNMVTYAILHPIKRCSYLYLLRKPNFVLTYIIDLR